MKSKRKIGFGAAAVLALTLLVPAQAAHAIDRVQCNGRSDFLKITENWDYNNAQCYANEGIHDLNRSLGPVWASEIRSGNNDIRWQADGVWHYLPRWHVLTFPNVGTIHLRAIEIL